MLLTVKQCPCKKPISHVLDNHSDVVANLQNSVCNSCTPTCRCLPSMLQCGRRRWKDPWLFVCVCLCGIQNGPLHIFNTMFQDSFTLLWLIWSLKTREEKLLFHIDYKFVKHEHYVAWRSLFIQNLPVFSFLSPTVTWLFYVIVMYWWHCCVVLEYAGTSFHLLLIHPILTRSWRWSSSAGQAKMLSCIGIATTC